MDKKITKISKLSIDQLRKNLASISQEEARHLLAHVIKTRAPHWRQKVDSILNVLESDSELLAVGKELPGLTFLQLIDAKHSAKRLRRLQPVLMGLEPTEMLSMVMGANLQQLDILRGDVMKTPLKHQLIQLAELLEADESEMTEKLENIKHSIAQLDVTLLDGKKLQQVEKMIVTVRRDVEKLMENVDRLLGLAWHIEAPSLVDKLTDLQEYLRNDLRVGVGHPLSEKRAATGLFALLDEQLQGPFDHLPADAPAEEALIALGIKTYGDVEEVGIIKTTSARESRTALCCGAHRLEEDAQWSLANLDLHSVADFARERICSLSLLAEYVQAKASKPEQIRQT